MNRSSHTAATGAGALLIVALCIVDCCRVVGAETLPSSSDRAVEGVVVLQTGGVLVGRVWSEGERYVVDGPNSQLRVATNDVAFTCRTLDEAYEIKRRQMNKSSATAGEHLELAEWCLRQDLSSQAAQELAAARKLEPKNPKLSLYERRLVVAARPKTRIERASADAQPIAAKSGLAKSAEELKQLRAMARTLPDDVVERFTRKVQPLLVNNCTTSGCHQPSGEQEFQLDRAMLHGLGNRRTTLRNLEATLALVDHTTPQFSPLLTIPRTAHGGSKQPLLGTRQEDQFEQLVEWVAMVTNTEVPASAPLANNQQPTREAGGAAPGVVQASHEEPVQFLESKPHVQYGATPKPRGPRDPFDPEIFNNLKATPSAAAGPMQGN